MQKEIDDILIIGKEIDNFWNISVSCIFQNYNTSFILLCTHCYSSI